MKADYEITFDEFWKELVCNDDGTLNEDAIKRELHDYRFLLKQVPLVYDHVTGGRVSKPNTHASAVISESDDYIRRLLDDEIADMKAEKEC